MRLKLLCKNSLAVTAMALAFLLAANSAFAQGSSFTYQGRLTDGGTVANGLYDLQFALFDSASSGAQIGSTQTLNSVLVSAGVFSVTLDFGANSFSGANRFLEISARPSGAGSFNLLTPRQQVTATPYAIRSVNASLADTATNATNATTATNATQLGGIAASQYVQTSDSRLSDSRPPTAGSSNYIQTNPGAAQNANFNISGNGTAGGTLSAAQYNIGGQRVLSNIGNSNLFAGVLAGQVNSSGNGNVFVGPSAGRSNTIGGDNSFFGSNAGFSNVGDSSGNGSGNSFFGVNAGQTNTSGSGNSYFGAAAGAGAGNATGGFNSYFGESAGSTFSSNNVISSGNTFIGAGAGLGDFAQTQPSITNATAIGFGAHVNQSNSIVLGMILSEGIADTKVGIGTTAPVFRLHVVDPGAAGLRVQTNTGGGAVASFGGFGDFQIDSNGQVGGRFIVQQAGRVGISTNAPTATLSVNGTANKPGGGSWDNFSDERLKNIKGRFNSGLKAVMQLQPLRYEYKRENALNLKSDGEHIGFSAQAVQKIIPEAVTANDKGYLLINNDPIMWTMLNAIKEQQAQIELQQTRNEAQQLQIKRQQAQIEKQQRALDALKSLVCRSHSRARVCK